MPAPYTSQKDMTFDLLTVSEFGDLTVLRGTSMLSRLLSYRILGFRVRQLFQRLGQLQHQI